MTQLDSPWERQRVPPGIHGGPDLRELDRLGIAPGTVIDFSVCTNPFGPSPRVGAALADVPVDHYPDREATALRTALADAHGVSPAHILPGNGASELIWLAALALLRPGDRSVVVGPTYGEYARAATLAGATTIIREARPDDRFSVPVAEVERALREERPRVVFLCNPNNPTGAALGADIIERWARQCEQTWFVVDEAYQPFAAGVASAVPLARGNVLVLRSMTKDYALAGLRLGYAVGAPGLLARLREAQPPWSVNALAQAAGVAALADQAHRDATLAQVARAKQQLVADLEGLGLAPVPSVTHYFLLRVGDGAAVRLALLRRGILVRDCGSFGLPAYLRIATRRPGENTQLVAALREVLR